MATEPAASPSPQTDWHLREAHELARLHQVDLATGLEAAQVSERSLLHGLNELPASEERSLWQRVREQFSDFMILVLLAAALISGFIGDWIDSIVILIIVLLNALIGIVQAWRADQALAALRQLAAPQATVLRAGDVQ